MTPALSIRNVRLTLGASPILTGVDLDVQSGEWLSIIGPNGAGKSTLLRAVAGLADVEGEVHLGTVPIAGLDRRGVAREVAMVPQIPVVPPGMTVADYVLLGRTPHLGFFATESADDVEIAHDALANLELVHLRDRTVDSLSGGERQRVLIARALAQGTSILLLDEPTTALDVGHQQDVLDLVADLRDQRSLTVVGVMHDLTLAGQYSDRVALMVCGQIVAVGAPSEVLTEDRLSSLYGARVRVIDDGSGPVVVPVRSRVGDVAAPPTTAS